MAEEKKNAGFRDRISTVNSTGGRNWVYARKPKGRLYVYRRILGYFLIVFLPLPRL
ncbi:MAG: hypothetical protein HC896_13270 [Bacteroidales bacterium]|nr:hypothetical protein [Bacteroidales bacterium]